MVFSLRNPLRILVIEDNKADAEIIKIYLKEADVNHVMYTATSLKQGLEIAQDTPLTITLLDLNVTDSNGINTLSAYLNVAKHIPVIVMTGLNNQKIGSESIKVGAQDFLVKGEFDHKQLIRNIRFSIERFNKQEKDNQMANELTRKVSDLEDANYLSSIGTFDMDIVTSSMVWSEELFKIFRISFGSFSPTLSDFLQLVQVEDRERVRSFFVEASSHEEFGPVEFKVFLDNRFLRQLSVRTRIRFDDATNKISLFGSVQDITKIEQTSEKEEPKEGEINTPEQEPALPDELIKSFRALGFNIRTPLNTLVNLLYLLEKTPLSNQQERLVKDIKTAIDDLSFTLINLVNLSLLSQDLTNDQQDIFRPIDILESVQRVMAFKAHQQQRELDFYIDTRLAFNAVGDANRFGQLLFCLLELALLRSEQDSFIKLRAVKADDVKDTQLCVLLEYAGQPLAGAPTADGTLVLGTQSQLLHTVFRRLLKQLAVRMTESVANNAVTIDLVFNLRSGENSLSELPEVPHERLRVLLVEDHPMHQIATKQILTTWSSLVSVDLANDGEAAVVAVQRSTYDVILMDLQMPVMDGQTAAQIIRKSSSTPIIALTAGSSKQEEEQCYDLGMNDYLSKPFNQDDLKRRIMRLVYKP